MQIPQDTPHRSPAPSPGPDDEQGPLAQPERPDTGRQEPTATRYLRYRRKKEREFTGEEAVIDCQTGKAISWTDNNSRWWAEEVWRRDQDAQQLDIGRVFREKQDEFIRTNGPLNKEQATALMKIAWCRTVPLDNRVERCMNPGCGSFFRRMKSCGHRTCPKCQGQARNRWFENRMEEIRPGTRYVNLTFKLPPELRPIALQNKAAVCAALFRAAAEALKKVARKSRNLDEVGFIMLLQTWARDLFFHPHIHVVMPQGGFSRGTWIEFPDENFLSKDEIREEFRDTFTKFILQTFQVHRGTETDGGESKTRPPNRRKSRLEFHGDLKNLSAGKNFMKFIESIPLTDWHVFSKQIRLTGTGGILGYLARTISSGPIVGGRLASYSGDKVQVPVRTGLNDEDKETVELDTMDFIRRYLMHVLPSGFWRSRAFGFLSLRKRKSWRGDCRKAGGSESGGEGNPGTDEVQTAGLKSEVEKKYEVKCPCCKVGKMKLEYVLEHVSGGSGV